MTLEKEGQEPAKKNEGTSNRMFRQRPVQPSQKPPKPPPRVIRERPALERRISLISHDTEDSEAGGEKNVIPILEGQMEDLPPISSKTVRVFLSSTFSGGTSIK